MLPVVDCCHSCCPFPLPHFRPQSRPHATPTQVCLTTGLTRSEPDDDTASSPPLAASRQPRGLQPRGCTRIALPLPPHPPRPGISC